jgi:hypothetical protein
VELWLQIVVLTIGSITAGVFFAFFLVNLVKRFGRKHEFASGDLRQWEYIPIDLIDEVNNNYRIATEHDTYKLLPFETQRWLTYVDGDDRLPVYFRQVLEQAYSFMHLANQLVWVSTGLNRRSPNIDRHYTNLCSSITERLNEIRPLFDRSTKTNKLR